jgi:hypothetical protein
MAASSVVFISDSAARTYALDMIENSMLASPAVFRCWYSRSKKDEHRTASSSVSIKGNHDPCLDHSCPGLSMFGAADTPDEQPVNTPDRLRRMAYRYLRRSHLRFGVPIRQRTHCQAASIVCRSYCQA